MANNTANAIAQNLSFTTGPVPLVVGVLNPANSAQSVWDCGVGMNYAVMTTTITGGPASMTVLLEGTVDGTNWVTLTQSGVVSGETTYSSGMLPFTNLRARCTAVSGGTSPTITVNVTASPFVMTTTSAGTNPTTTVAQGNANTGLTPGWRVAPGVTNPITVQNAQISGNGTTADFGAAVSTIMFQIVPTGTITAGAVTMQLSLDGVTWLSPPTASLNNYSGATIGNPYTLATGVNALFDIGIGNIAARYARCIISTPITGGGNVTVQASGY